MGTVTTVAHSTKSAHEAVRLTAGHLSLQGSRRACACYRAEENRHGFRSPEPAVWRASTEGEYRGASSRKRAYRILKFPEILTGEP